MGAKCFKDSDTPWIYLRCNCIAIHNSDNANVDFTDGEEKEEEKPVKLSWLRRQINERRERRAL